MIRLLSYNFCIYFIFSILIWKAYAAGGGSHGSSKDNAEGELRIFYPCELYNGTKNVTLGEKFIIRCCLPKIELLKWEFNGTEVINNTRGYIIQTSVGNHSVSQLSVAQAKKYHSGNYRCTDFNPHFHSVYVDTGEKVSSNATKFLKEDEPLVLECKLKFEDKVKIKWLKNNIVLDEKDEHYSFIAENHTMVIKSAKKDDVGSYQCRTVDHTPEMYYDISVIILSYKKMVKSLTILNGESLRLECICSGYPIPNITWYKDGISIDKAFNDSHYQLEPNTDGTANGTFVIEESVYEDRGSYVCNITSLGVNFTTATMVRVKYMYAALWPFLGICAEVIILCLIIFIYEKKKIKSDFEESDTDQPTDQKNTSDHNKDLRQRK